MILLHLGTSSYHLKQLSYRDLIAKCNAHQYTLINKVSSDIIPDYFVIHEPFGGGFKMKLYHCLELGLPVIMDGKSAAALKDFEEDMHYTTLEKAKNLTSREQRLLASNLRSYIHEKLSKETFEEVLRLKINSIS